MGIIEKVLEDLENAAYSLGKAFGRLKAYNDEVFNNRKVLEEKFINFDKLGNGIIEEIVKLREDNEQEK